MRNKTSLDFQGRWVAKINYHPPIVSKSFILNIDTEGNVCGNETVTLEGNIADQEIKFSGKLIYNGEYFVLDLIGDNDLFGKVKVKAVIDRECPPDSEGVVHYEGKFENEFIKNGEKNTGLISAYRHSA